ncbi:phage tail protein [Terriglobus albidus]|uniref:Phage tail protein n=2 Tax=Terriglobus albidus TaxID=1592106 RepID=A0A5B9EHI7_9BACT|nr:phage tail protein [Terriglobus albidus]
MAHHFEVEIDGLLVGGFTEVSGLDVELKTFPVPEGGQNDFEEVRTSGVKHSRLVLKRGLTTADMLWQWHADAMQGKIERRNGSIVLMTSNLLEMWRWNFRDAYPVKWTGPAFKAGEAAVAFESIELVHRGISKDLNLTGMAIGGVSAIASL